MKKIILFIGFLMPLVLWGQMPEFEWVGQMEGNGQGNSIATDQAGNIFISGVFYDTIDINPVPTIYHPLISEGSSDVFVAKFTPDGQLAWAHSFGDYYHDSSRGIATDIFGNVIVSGSFRGTIDFDPGLDTHYMTAWPVNDLFLLKLDSEGDFIWAKQVGNGVSSENIVTDEAGNVYATGLFSVSADFDPGQDTFEINSSGSFDIFVLKLDLNGEFVWAKGMGGEYFDFGYSIALDGEYNVYITGRFEGIADFDPGPEIYNMWTGGFEDDIGMFVTKLDSEGNFVWAKKVGDSDSSVIGFGIAVDDSGNSYTSGRLRGEADFDPGPNANILTSEDGRAFVLKLDDAGNYCWVKAMEGVGRSTGRDIVLDKYSNLYTVGYFEEIVDFDPDPDTFELEAADRDLYILKLDSTGFFSWAGSFYGGTYQQIGGPSILVDTRGTIYTTGSFGNTNDFDPGPETYELHSLDYYSDAFVHKMRQSCFSRSAVQSSSPVICEGDTISLTGILDDWILNADYLWSNGDTTDVAMVAPDTSSTYNLTIYYTNDTTACEVTATVDVSVLPTPDSTFQEITSCDSLSAGQVIWAYPSANGCDSIVVMNTSWLSPPDIPQPPTEIVITPNTLVFEIGVPSIPTATGYEWTVPSAVQIVSGGGTNTITLDWSAMSTGGSICVRASNDCGSSHSACTELMLDTTDTADEAYNRLEKVLIYPNPANHFFHILFEDALHRKLQLIDIRGKVILQQDSFNENTIMNIEHLAAGVYSLDIQQMANKFKYRKKIIVLR